MATKKDKSLLAVLVAAGVAGGMAFTPPFEGKENRPYVENIAGGSNVTYCFGHMGKPTKSYYTDAECKIILEKDLIKHVDYVAQNTDPYLDPLMYTAVGDFALNTGNGNYYNSSVRRLFNEGKFREGCSFILKYKFVKGTDCFLPQNAKICGGIKIRREAEASLCHKGVDNMEQQNKKKKQGFFEWLLSNFKKGSAA